ncbi:MAG: PspC domain-containing protein [bacterium]|nr:PspC domain-containing protein [bacterium]
MKSVIIWFAIYERFMGKKILYRTGKNRVVAGVCGGTAEYFDIDPGIIRVLWLLSVLAAGAGIWAYLVAWLIVPESPEGGRKHFRMNSKIEVKKEKKNMPEGLSLHGKSSVFGLSLMIIGVIFLANNFLPQLRLDKYWPIIPIALGLVLIFSSYNHKK